MLGKLINGKRNKTTMDKENLYTSCAKYYDLLPSKKDIKKEVKFISKILNKHKVNSLLDVGCGTGLHLIPLKRAGFDAEGLDLSANMLKEARKKEKNLRLYRKNMTNFKLNKKYGAIICLSSTLISVPTFETIKKTLRAIHSHLDSNGVALLDLPNHEKEIKEQNKVRETVRHKTKKSSVDSVFYSYKKDGKWIEEWYGEVMEGDKISKFKCVWNEFIYSQKKLESYLKKLGFRVIKIYGTMTGSKFNKNKSYRRVYLCQKIN